MIFWVRAITNLFIMLACLFCVVEQSACAGADCRRSALADDVWLPSSKIKLVSATRLSMRSTFEGPFAIVKMNDNEYGTTWSEVDGSGNQVQKFARIDMSGNLLDMIDVKHCGRASLASHGSYYYAVYCDQLYIFAPRDRGTAVINVNISSDDISARTSNTKTVSRLCPRTLETRMSLPKVVRVGEMVLLAERDYLGNLVFSEIGNDGNILNRAKTTAAACSVSNVSLDDGSTLIGVNGPSQEDTRYIARYINGNLTVLECKDDSLCLMDMPSEEPVSMVAESGNACISIVDHELLLQRVVCLNTTWSERGYDIASTEFGAAVGVVMSKQDVSSLCAFWLDQVGKIEKTHCYSVPQGLDGVRLSKRGELLVAVLWGRNGIYLAALGESDLIDSEWIVRKGVESVEIAQENEQLSVCWKRENRASCARFSHDGEVEYENLGEDGNLLSVWPVFIGSNPAAFVVREAPGGIEVGSIKSFGSHPQVRSVVVPDPKTVGTYNGSSYVIAKDRGFLALSQITSSGLNGQRSIVMPEVVDPRLVIARNGVGIFSLIDGPHRTGGTWIAYSVQTWNRGGHFELAYEYLTVRSAGILRVVATGEQRVFAVWLQGHRELVLGVFEAE